MDKKMQLSETVMLVDAAFLNFVVEDLKKYFEHILNRQLSEMNLALLTTYWALEAGMQGNENKANILFVYDKTSERLCHCYPSDLKKELDGVAFSDQFGEYLFSGVPCEEMVSREDLFLDLINLVSDAEEVKKLIVISFNEEYGEKVSMALNKMKGKEIIQFRMNEPEEQTDFRWEMLAYPVMQALGIKSDEL